MLIAANYIALEVSANFLILHFRERLMQGFVVAQKRIICLYIELPSRPYLKGDSKGHRLKC